MLNKQGQDKIDWTDWSANPISGCLHGCDYCYMHRMEKRFPGIMKPAFHPHRLDDLKKLKKPSKIFVGSSGDMWGAWVPDEWIEAVLDVVRHCPQHIFQFLTKNPVRYGDFPPLPNAWYGTTVDGTKRTKNNISLLVQGIQPCSAIRFVSFEPLLAPVVPDLFGISWAIVGANSNHGAKKPPDRWANQIIDNAHYWDCAVWVKDNYKYNERIKEFPKEGS